MTAPELVSDPLTMRELAVALIRHYGLHEGKYDLMMEFQIGVGAIGPDPVSQSPGAMIGVSKIGLTRSKADSPMTVDAAVVNPVPTRRRAARSAT